MMRKILRGTFVSKNDTLSEKKKIRDFAKSCGF